MEATTITKSDLTEEKVLTSNKFRKVSINLNASENRRYTVIEIKN
jgi:hypothetical protein